MNSDHNGIRPLPPPVVPPRKDFPSQPPVAISLPPVAMSLPHVSPPPPRIRPPSIAQQKRWPLVIGSAVVGFAIAAAAAGVGYVTLKPAKPTVAQASHDDDSSDRADKKKSSPGASAADQSPAVATPKTKAAVAASMTGRWVQKTPKHPSGDMPGVDLEVEEHLVVTPAGVDGISVAREFRQTRSPSDASQQFSCNKKKAIVDAGKEVFESTIRGDVVIASSTKVERGETDCDECHTCSQPNNVVVLELSGDTLLVTPIEGKSVKDQVTFQREL